MNSHARQLLNFLEAILTIQRFQSDQIQRSSCKIFTAHYACRNDISDISLWSVLSSYTFVQLMANCIVNDVHSHLLSLKALL